MAFFRKNFHEEMQRLAVGPSPDRSLVARPSGHTLLSSQPASLSEQRSPEEAGPDMRQQFSMAPLNLGRPFTSPSLSPRSTRENGQLSPEPLMSGKQTPLQRGLAHLARHGFNGVASGPRDNGDGDMSEESPHNSFVNGSGPTVTHLSGAASVTTSTMGSMGSLRGRLSKFGSLSFGRRDG